MIMYISNITEVRQLNNQIYTQRKKSISILSSGRVLQYLPDIQNSSRNFTKKITKNYSLISTHWLNFFQRGKNALKILIPSKMGGVGILQKQEKGNTRGPKLALQIAVAVESGGSSGDAVQRV